MSKKPNIEQIYKVLSKVYKEKTEEDRNKHINIVVKKYIIYMKNKYYFQYYNKLTNTIEELIGNNELTKTKMIQIINLLTLHK